MSTTTEKVLLIVFGRTAAGKSMIGRYLSEQKGFYHIEGSSVIKRETNEEDAKQFESKRQYYSWLLNSRGFDLVEVAGVLPLVPNNSKIVYTGARTATGIDTLYKELGRTRTKMMLMWVETDRNIRYGRAVERKRDTDLHLANFDDCDTDDFSRMWLVYGELLADFIVVNNGTMRELSQKLDVVLSTDKCTTSGGAETLYRIEKSLYELDELIQEVRLNEALYNEACIIKKMLEKKCRICRTLF